MTLLDMVRDGHGTLSSLGRWMLKIPYDNDDNCYHPEQQKKCRYQMSGSDTDRRGREKQRTNDCCQPQNERGTF